MPVTEQNVADLIDDINARLNALEAACPTTFRNLQEAMMTAAASDRVRAAIEEAARAHAQTIAATAVSRVIGDNGFEERLVGQLTDRMNRDIAAHVASRVQRIPASRDDVARMEASIENMSRRFSSIEERDYRVGADVEQIRSDLRREVSVLNAEIDRLRAQIRAAQTPAQ